MADNRISIVVLSDTDQVSAIHNPVLKENVDLIALPKIEWSTLSRLSAESIKTKVLLQLRTPDIHFETEDNKDFYLG